MRLISGSAHGVGRQEGAFRLRGRLSAVALGLLLLTPRPGATESTAGAFWASLLVPGLGQKMTGHSRAATGFLAVEIGLWSAVLGLKQVADIRRDNFRAYAAEHAGTQGSRTQASGSVFFDDLGFYDSRQQHNQYARVDDGVTAELYPDTAAFFWEWDSDASRLRYRDLRNSSETADRQALFAVGLVVANHIVAALHTRRVADVSLTSGAAAKRHSMLALEPHPTLTGLALVHRF